MVSACSGNCRHDPINQTTTAAMIQSIKRQPQFSGSGSSFASFKPVVACLQIGLPLAKQLPRGLVLRKKSAGENLRCAHAVEREFQVEQGKGAKIVANPTRNQQEKTVDAPKSFDEGFTHDPVRAKKWLRLASDCCHRKTLYVCGIKICSVCHFLKHRNFLSKLFLNNLKILFQMVFV